MKIIVTGAAGAIGSHLCERLLDLKHEVVGIDALTDYYSPAIKKINAEDVKKRGGKMHFLNLIFDDIDPLIEGADIIFHLAAQPGISATTPLEDYLNNNIVATYKILERAKQIKSLKGFIFASTSSVYGKEAKSAENAELKPASYYGITKLAAEQLVMSYYRESSFPATALRFFSVYGERERPEKLYHKLIKAICEEREFPIYDGSENHVRSYTYVGDIIDGCILTMENMNKCAGEIFNLGNNETNTTGEGIKIIEELIGKKAKLKTLPKRPGDQIETSADISKASKFLGYKPKIKLAKGLEAEVRWYKDKIFGIKNL